MSYNISCYRNDKLVYFQYLAVASSRFLGIKILSFVLAFVCSVSVNMRRFLAHRSSCGPRFHRSRS